MYVSTINIPSLLKYLILLFNYCQNKIHDLNKKSTKFCDTAFHFQKQKYNNNINYFIDILSIKLHLFY
jgi:hypothetical protein